MLEINFVVGNSFLIFLVASFNFGMTLFLFVDEIILWCFSFQCAHRNIFEDEIEFVMAAENVEDGLHPEEFDIFSSDDEGGDDDLPHPVEEPGEEAPQEAYFNNPCNQENPALLADPPAAPPAAPPTFGKLLHKIQHGFSDVITNPPLVSRAELLLMVLGLSIQHNQNHTQLLHTVTLINSVFGNSILPHSCYLLDQILNTDCGINYHFYCPECFYYFGKIDYLTVRQVVCETPGCNTTSNIHDLTAASFFVTFDICLQIEYLLKSDSVFSQLKSPVELINGRGPGTFSDIYDGSSYQNFARSTALVIADKIISFIFSTDGSPLFKSSKNSIWPLQLTICELPPLIRMNNIILGGLWFGKSKPPMDLFLIPFMAIIKSLSTHGMNVQLKDEVICHVKAYIILCCVDSGARGSVQGLKTHSGYGSCNWCTHPGEWSAHAVRFPVLEYVPQQRTHEGMRTQGEAYLDTGIIVDGVKGLSALFGAPEMDVVKGMSVEYMHLVNLGLVRQFLYAWLNDADEDWYIGTDAEEELINEKLASLSPPVEVRRLPRTLSEKKFWNARELENWLLLYSVPVLSGILKAKYLNHWKLLVQAVYLLLQTKLTAEDCRNAHILLSHFIVKTEELYGKSMMTFNLHILSHLADHVLRWGNLQFSSAFCFEAANGLLKQLIHAQRGIPHQIKRALSHRLAFQLLQAECSSRYTDGFLEKIKKKPLVRCLTVKNCHYIGSSKSFDANDEEKWLLEQAGYDYGSFVLYDKVIKDKIVYNISKTRKRKTNNSAALVRDSRLVKIEKIAFNPNTNQGLVFCKEIHCSAFCRFPINIRNVSLFLRQVDNISEDLQLVPVNDLSCICFMSYPVGNFITPMSNVMNVW